MKAKKKHDVESVDTDTSEETVMNDTEAAAEQAEGETDAASEIIDELADEDAELVELQESLATLSDKHMRVMAEYDNFRRRTKLEKEALYADSICDVVTEWLPVIDNLERALAAADQVAEDETLASFRQGVEMVLNQAMDTMKKLGVEVIEAQGKTFDPNLHSAVLHIDDDRYGDQEVVEVLEKGYIRGERVIRHSIVKVAN